MGRGVRDKKCVRDLGVRGQTALVRVDFNVPFKPGTTEISDDGRIRAALPTLRYLLERDCRLVVCSHLGRPKGQVVESLRMSPVSQRLSELLGVQVAQCAQVVGDEARSMASVLAAGDVMMLET
ncbi:MAG: phosphoglycerate kinase, partial [Chloroflexi bacterium]|nr:phosphoglycerate kinase [Chloroflexota bacterium]